MGIEIWQVASEAKPLAQTGGLADVLRALPAALARLGHAVRRFLPAHGCIDRAGFLPEDADLDVPLGSRHVPVRFLSRTGPDGVVTTLVECGELFGREGIYGPPGEEYPDNARRFTLLSRAVCERARRSGKPPDILHAHDWHAALLPLFTRFGAPWRRRPGTVLTIHNLGYQGHFGASELEWLSLPARTRGRLFRPDGIEFYGGVNFLKAGILYADRITTVSPSYAKEILGEPFGCGLDGVLRTRAADLAGILNGADYEVWNPAADPHLPRAYGPESLEGKEESRAAVRAALQLPPAGRAILGVVSRLARQKGIDVVVEAAPALLEEGADLAILGAGDVSLGRALEELHRRRPDRVGLFLGFNEQLSHLITAGSDLLLVPSRYEPCGLSQMHAMRYGTLPVVHRTGGLGDTVRDAEEDPARGTGFVFDGLTSERLVETVRRALDLRRADPATWRRLQQRAMAEDFSWAKAARRYVDLYQNLPT